jgi:putative transposase
VIDLARRKAAPYTLNCRRAIRNATSVRPRRLANRSYVGRCGYFLTLCTFANRACFTDPGVVSDVWLQFVNAADRNHFEVLAYCFMPDHLHLLVEGISDAADLRLFVASAKRQAAHAAKSWVRGRLWQPGYYDRVLRDRDDIHAIIKYIVENPVRAGICRRPSDYPFMGGSRVATGTSAM